MQELVTISYNQIDDETVQTVDARELWKKLEVKTDFSDWIKGRIDKYEFVQGVDFIIPEKKGTLESMTYGKDKIDYSLSLGMAKELSMVENNAKGKEARRYFINREKELRKLQAKIAPILANEVYQEIALEVLEAGYTGKTALTLAAKHLRDVIGFEVPNQPLGHYKSLWEFEGDIPGWRQRQIEWGKQWMDDALEAAGYIEEGDLTKLGELHSINRKGFKDTYWDTEVQNYLLCLRVVRLPIRKQRMGMTKSLDKACKRKHLPKKQ